MASKKKKAAEATPERQPCEVHVYTPSDSPDPMHLCERHYNEWRDGPREGPAVVSRHAFTGEGCPLHCDLC